MDDTIALDRDGCRDGRDDPSYGGLTTRDALAKRRRRGGETGGVRVRRLGVHFRCAPGGRERRRGEAP